MDINEVADNIRALGRRVDVGARIAVSENTVIYSVHAVDLKTRQAQLETLWMGHREPSGTEIGEATGHEGGIVRRSTAEKVEYDFGGGWHESAEAAIEAAL